jgi:acyl-CoA thioesterase-2
VYDVDRIRDGKSFATRRVVAIQAGRPIFSMAASFQQGEPGFDHADEMPQVPPPEDLLSEQALAIRVVDRIPEALRALATADRPIELRPVAPTNPLRPRAMEPKREIWYRAAGELPDDPGLHRQMLAYASDFAFLGTAMAPHAVSWMIPGMQVATIDHAMWFHRPFRMDDWLLHVIESPSASGARGLVRGRFFTRDGALVASTMQEGLIRDRRPAPPEAPAHK